MDKLNKADIDKSEEKKIDFNGIFSSEYDNKIQEIIPGYDTLHELVQYILKDNLNESPRILVAGAGTGNELIHCSKKNPQWSFVGFDPAEPMLEIAGQKISANKLENRINLVHGIINDVDESEFDGATSILVMHFLPDDGTKLEYLREISARLKPGAPIILVDLEGEKGSEEFKILNGAWKSHQLSERNDDDLVDEEFTIRGEEVQIIPQERIESLFHEAGFNKIHKFYKAFLFGGYIAKKKDPVAK